MNKIDNEKSVIVANLTWNPTGWRGLYTNPNAGHKYARGHPGHESLNFKFDKKIDTKIKIHGFVQWTYHPKSFKNGGIVLFHSNNLELNQGEFVGIYGNAEVLEPSISSNYKGFQGNKLWSNLRADRNLSILFPIPLKANKFGKDKFDPQVGFTYKNTKLILNIINAEIIELKKNGIKIDEYKTLLLLYEMITGTTYSTDDNIEQDEKEQTELVDHFSGIKSHEIIDDLNSITSTAPEKILISHKTYKRNNKSIALLKLLHNFKCQVCNKSIKIRNGKYYVEAAHIISKSLKGPELPKNILILCPNHHKEFDLSDKKIVEHNDNVICFKMNGITYTLPLNPKNRLKKAPPKEE